MSFANLKQNRGSALKSLQQKVNDDINSSNSGGAPKDPRFWKHTYNKDTKVGTSLIRFLPYGDGNRVPWSKYIKFYFKGATGKYYNNRSLRTLGQDDPVALFNSLQWERNLQGDQDAVKKRKRSIRHIANIVVLEDNANPENVGKNFLFEFGPAILEFITNASSPEYEDIKPIPVFDLWEGANFRIRSKESQGGFLTYDDSTFMGAEPLHADNKVLEQVYNQMMPLEEFEEASLYKTYDELNAELIATVGPPLYTSVTGLQVPGVEVAAGGGAQPNAQPDPFAQGAQGGAQGGAQQGTGNPFASAGDAGTDTVVGGADAPVDPFGGSGQVNQNQGQGGDPFANAETPSSNPFAGGQDAQQQTTTNTGGDASGTADPFANINL